MRGIGLATPEDVRVHLTFPDHDKIVDFEKDLGVLTQGGSPVTCWLRLWVWVTRSDVMRRDGIMRDQSPEQIERRAGWGGAPGAFFDALKKNRMIELHSGQWCIHDWIDSQNWVVNADVRSKKGKMMKALQVAKETEKLEQKLLSMGLDPVVVASPRRKNELPAPPSPLNRDPLHAPTVAPIGLGTVRTAVPVESGKEHEHKAGRVPAVQAAKMAALQDELIEATVKRVSENSSQQCSEQCSKPAPFHSRPSAFASPPLPALRARDAPAETAKSGLGARAPTAGTAGDFQTESEGLAYRILRGLAVPDAECRAVVKLNWKALRAPPEEIYLSRLMAWAIECLRKKPRSLALMLTRCKIEPNNADLDRARDLVRQEQGYMQLTRRESEPCDMATILKAVAEKRA